MRLQNSDDVEVLPHLFLYWKEHGRQARNPAAIAGSIRAFIGFLLQDSVGVRVWSSELTRTAFRRFINWRMESHSFTVDWLAAPRLTLIVFAHAACRINAYKWRQIQVRNSRPFNRSSATLRKMLLGDEARLAIRRPQPFCLTVLLACVARENMDLLMAASVCDATSHTRMPWPWLKATIVSQYESFLRSLKMHRYLLRPGRAGCLAARLPMVKPDFAHETGSGRFRMASR
jgi:hypothetical protein